MATYTSLATLHGEIFTEKNPAFVKMLNDLNIEKEDLDQIIHAIKDESNVRNKILNSIKDHGIKELDTKVGLIEKRLRRFVADYDNKSEIINFPEDQKIHGNVTVDNLPEIQGVYIVNVKDDLVKIKNTQDQIITALQATNDNLLATNNHLNSVIKDERLQSDTQLTGSNVEQSIVTKSPDIEVVFREPIKDFPLRSILVEPIDIPKNVQSVGFLISRNDVKKFVIELSFLDKDNRLVVLDNLEIINKNLTILPVLGDKIRVRKGDNDDGTNPVTITVMFYYEAQEIISSLNNIKIVTLQNAITELGGTL